MWDNLKRLIKPNGAIVLFGSEPFSSLLRTSNLRWYKYDWYWKKSKGGNFPHAKNMPLKIVETVSVFSQGIIAHGEKRMIYNPQGVTEGTIVVKQNPNTSELKYHRESQSQHKEGYKCQGNNYPNTLLVYPSKDKKVHPTQKPVALMEYLIKTYTNEGETILDFTMGSGSTGVAARNTGRQFIGIEKDQKYFEIARKRIIDNGITSIH
jgi:DNA modification methylase